MQVLYRLAILPAHVVVVVVLRQKLQVDQAGFELSSALVSLKLISDDSSPQIPGVTGMHHEAQSFSLLSACFFREPGLPFIH